MITFDHVTKRYEDGTVPVEDLNLSCATGEITIFVGSFAGKLATSVILSVDVAVAPLTRSTLAGPPGPTKEAALPSC
jgi:ABC-type proline/glycine betaine transport system ATPase subunit